MEEDPLEQVSVTYEVSVIRGFSNRGFGTASIPRETMRSIIESNLHKQTYLRHKFWACN